MDMRKGADAALRPAPRPPCVVSEAPIEARPNSAADSGRHDVLQASQGVPVSELSTDGALDAHSNVAKQGRDAAFTAPHESCHFQVYHGSLGL